MCWEGEMWIEILFIWIENVFELQVEMAKAGHHVTKHTFAYLKSFSIIIIIINSIDYSTNNIHEDRVNKCRKMAIRLLRPNTKPYAITPPLPLQLLPHPQIHTFQKNCHSQNQ